MPEEKRERRRILRDDPEKPMKLRWAIMALSDFAISSISDRSMTWQRLCFHEQMVIKRGIIRVIRHVLGEEITEEEFNHRILMFKEEEEDDDDEC